MNPPETLLPPLAEARIRDFTIEVDTIGELDAANSTMVASGLRGGKGKIIFLVDDGTWVRTGDTLVTLDPAPFEEDIRNLEGQVKMIRAAVEAKVQVFEWEKSQVEKEISTARFGIKKAKLELLEYKNGEGPLKLVQLREDADEIKKEKAKYQNYLDDLNALKIKGYDHPTEINRALEELADLDEKLQVVLKKYEKYKTHVYPSLIERHKTAVEQAEMELEKTMKASVHRIAQARSGLNEVEARLNYHVQQLNDARRKLDKTKIKAPSDGIVILYEAYRDGQKRKPRIGDQVLQGHPLLYLPDITAMVVNTEVREVDLHKVRIGQVCRIRVNAYPDKVLGGEISFIGALAVSRAPGSAGGAKYFKLSVKVTSEDPNLRPGMTAQVNINAEKVSQALTLPVGSVFGSRESPYCFKLDSGKLKKVSIRTGKRNNDVVQILSGLQEGDSVSKRML